MSSNLIIRLVVLLTGLVLASFVIGRFTRGLVRWVIFAALGLLAATALRIAFQQYPVSPPNLTASPPGQPTALPTAPPTSPTQPAPAPTASSIPAAPAAQPSPAQPSPAQPTEQPQSDTLDQGEVGFRDLPGFAQPFSPSGGGGTAQPQPSTAQPQPSPQRQPAQRSRPITGGW